MTDRQLWLLAGGNGAGKSTFYRLYLAPRGIHFVNADLIAKQLDRENPEEASYRASALAAKFRSDLLKSGTSFCFETVFSHPSKIDFVAEAKARGYEVIFVYIHLADTSLNQARVRQRVSEGGHDVPPDKIVSRIPRTMVNVSKVFPLVDEAWLFDNSYRDEPFQFVATVKKGVLTRHVNPLPDWAQALLAEFTSVA